MVKCRSSFSFPHEALHALPVRCNFRGKDFQRHVATESGVVREIYLTHSAHAEL